MKIGIDLGGSHIAIGIINDNMELVEKFEENLTENEKKQIEKCIIAKILNNTAKLLSMKNLDIKQIEKIGIACPGTIKQGVIFKSGNLGLNNFPLKQKLEENWNIPISIHNDGKCAAIAEKELGSLKQFQDCIFINIGTGIGGAVFMNGKMLEAKTFKGFEIGHMTINQNGRQCKCGKKGCFETYASMKSLKDTIRESYKLGNDIHSQELMNIILNRSQLSNKILEEYLENLKIGIANLIDIFEPEVISIGGSFAYYGNIFVEPLKQKLCEDNSTFNGRKDIIIKVAELKNDAGIVGAVAI